MPAQAIQEPGGQPSRYLLECLQVAGMGTKVHSLLIGWSLAVAHTGSSALDMWDDPQQKPSSKSDR